MAISTEAIQELETFFSDTTIPDKVRINSAIMQLNVAGQVKDKIDLLRGGMLSDKIAQVYFDDLTEIKEAIEQLKSQD